MIRCETDFEIFGLESWIAELITLSHLTRSEHHYLIEKIQSSFEVVKVR
jgi:hypothetical protein